MLLQAPSISKVPKPRFMLLLKFKNKPKRKPIAAHVKEKELLLKKDQDADVLLLDQPADVLKKE